MPFNITKLILPITILLSVSGYTAETAAAQNFTRPNKHTVLAGIITSIPFVLSIDTTKEKDWRFGIVLASLVGSVGASFISTNNLLFCIAAAFLAALLVWTFAPKLPPILIPSARAGDTASIKSLLLKGAGINATDKYGNTALILSAKWGHLDCVKYLVEQGADIHAKNKYGGTALMQAAWAGHLACVKYLVQKGADIEAKDNCRNTALMMSASWGPLAYVKYLHEQGADIHAKNKNGDTALMKAARWGGDLACVKYLVEQGADINAKAKNGNTALMYSAEAGHLDCFEYLRQQGAK